MTREEAIEELERLLRHWDDLENDKRCFWGYDKEAVALALSALRPVSREQVERMRYPWERIIDAYGNTEGYLCECGHMDNSASNFYRYCGLPKTDEAVDMMLERMETIR